MRTIPKRELVGAMAWVTTPALIGPVMGPPIGGFITTYASWHWIFLINVPIGLIGIVLATRYIDDVRRREHERFDAARHDARRPRHCRPGVRPFGRRAELLAVERSSRRSIVVGALFTAAYLLHARRTPNPALDLTLFRLPTFQRQRGRRLHVPARRRRAAVPAAADAARSASA